MKENYYNKLDELFLQFSWAHALVRMASSNLKST